MEHIKNNPIVLPSVGAFITGFLTAYFWFKVFSPKRAVPTTNIPTNTSTTNVAEKSEPVNTREYDSESDSEDSEDIPPHKMVLIVRNDLKMGKGKACAQCCHATLGAYLKAKEKIPEVVRRWERHGQAKVTLKVESEEAMDEIRDAAKRIGLITYVVMDAGRTQVKSGTRTVLAIGPAPAEEIDKVAGKLKLY